MPDGSVVQSCARGSRWNLVSLSVLLSVCCLSKLSVYAAEHCLMCGRHKAGTAPGDVPLGPLVLSLH